MKGVLVQIVTLSLLFSMFVTVLTPTALTLWFIANQSNIAETLCEQKAETANCCQGRCVLRKKIKQVSNAKQTSEGKAEEATDLKIDWACSSQDKLDESSIPTAKMKAVNSMPVNFSRIWQDVPHGPPKCML